MNLKYRHFIGHNGEVGRPLRKMDRFGLQDSGDDSSSNGSEQSAAAGRPSRATSFVKLSSIPSMYSKLSHDNETDTSGEEGSTPPATHGSAHYDQLDVSEELQELFRLVDAYEPVDLAIETPLRPFLPDKMFVAVGEADAGVRIPRPDGVPDGLGTAVLDEALPGDQSDVAVLELRLRQRSRTVASRNVAVRRIEKASEHGDEIDRWIAGVVEVQAVQPSPDVRHRNAMPRAEQILRAWPQGMAEEMRSGKLELPSAHIDMSVEDYARMLCSLLDIPVYEGGLVDSVHALLGAFAELQNSDIPYA